MNHRLVAHGAPVGPGKVRKSFHRMNDWEEFSAGVANFAFFPCVVHVSCTGRYTTDAGMVPKRKLLQQLVFLNKIESPQNVDQIEAAYDLSFEIMEDFLSWLYAETQNTGKCGPITGFDPSRVSFTPVKVDALFYGWSVAFEEEQFLSKLARKDDAKWRFQDLSLLYQIDN